MTVEIYSEKQFTLTLSTIRIKENVLPLKHLELLLSKIVTNYTTERSKAQIFNEPEMILDQLGILNVSICQ